MLARTARSVIGSSHRVVAVPSTRRSAIVADSRTLQFTVLRKKTNGTSESTIRKGENR